MFVWTTSQLGWFIYRSDTSSPEIHTSHESAVDLRARDLVGGSCFASVVHIKIDRSGPFWDFVAGRVAAPPAAALLGWELVDIDPEAGTIAVGFTARPEFRNPTGAIQGGFLAAMLDDTLGPALIAMLPDGEFAPTIDLHVQFLSPARPGRLTGHGRVVKRGREICFLAGELVDADDRLVAVATATARIQRLAFSTGDS